LLTTGSPDQIRLFEGSFGGATLYENPSALAAAVRCFVNAS
jgi:hypothetical protein